MPIFKYYINLISIALWILNAGALIAVHPGRSTAGRLVSVMCGREIFCLMYFAVRGCVLVTKPEYERTVTHTHAIPPDAYRNKRRLLVEGNN